MLDMKKKPPLLTILLILIALFVAGYIVMCNYDSQYTDYGRKSTYLTNFGYARALGVNRIEYDTLHKKYGTPVTEETYLSSNSSSVQLMRAAYPALDLYYIEEAEENGVAERSLFLVVIRDDSIHFGRKSIRIGSTKEQVHQAYASEPAISETELAYSAEDYPAVDEGFYGEDWSRILFCYDENGKVESMAYEPPEFY